MMPEHMKSKFEAPDPGYYVDWDDQPSYMTAPEQHHWAPW